MNSKRLITGAALTLVLAALLVAPAWPGATEPADEAAAEQPPVRGFLGVELRGLTPELRIHFGAPEGAGVLVAAVREDSPAAAAGIRVGDIITAVDSLAVGSARALSREIRHRPAETVSIELYRDGQLLQLGATVGERQAHRHHHGGRTPEEWAELAERWERWAEEFGESWGKWGEEFGQRWGEEFAEKWGEEHSESWQRWAEEMAARGEGWETMGEEIGRTVEKALSEIDWEEIGKVVEESMRSLEGVDWEAMSEQIERHLERLDRHLEKQRDDEAD